MIKLLIYYISHMRNFEQIVNTIHKCFHVFIHDRGGYKHKNTRIVSLPLYFSGKKILKTTIYQLWMLQFVVVRWYSLPPSETDIIKMLDNILCYFWWTCFSTDSRYTCGYKMCSSSRRLVPLFVAMETSYRGFSRKTKIS